MANDYFLMTETTTTISVCSSPAEEAEAIGDVVYIDTGITRLVLGIEEDDPLILQNYFRHHTKRFCNDPVFGAFHLRDWLQLRGHRCSLMVNPDERFYVRWYSQINLFFAERRYDTYTNEEYSDYGD